MRKYKYKFNIRKLVGDLGGVEETFSVLKSAESGIKKKTIHKWLERGNLPSDSVASIMIGLRRSKKDIDITAYIEEG